MTTALWYWSWHKEENTVKKEVLASAVSVLCSLGGLVLAVEKLLWGDRLSLFWVCAFGFCLGLTVWLSLGKKMGEKSLLQLLDLLVFVAGLGLSLFYGRYRLLGLLLMLAFPFRQRLGRTPAAEESEQAEKKSRFDEHIQR